MSASPAKRLIRLAAGLLLTAVAIVMALRAGVGLSPWEVFHQGLSRTFGITFGTASILVGIVAIVVAVLLGEAFGLGTLCNIFVVGWMVDLINFFGWIPVCHGLWTGLGMLLGSVAVMALGTCLYMSTGFGSGPRDALMVVLVRRLPLSVGWIRALLEGSALVIGFLLGGEVGIGTVVAVVGIGFAVQWTFTLFRFDPAAVPQQTLAQTLAEWRGLLHSSKGGSSR